MNAYTALEACFFSSVIANLKEQLELMISPTYLKCFINSSSTSLYMNMRYFVTMFTFDLPKNHYFGF